jgi:hypothetical protein
VSPELPGKNCEAGGIRVESGLDQNDNGALDPGGVETTGFVCSAPSAVDCSWLAFEGDDKVVTEIGPEQLHGSDFTVAAWVRAGDVSSGSHIRGVLGNVVASTGNQFSFGLVSDSPSIAYVSGAQELRATFTNYSLPRHEWHHLAVTGSTGEFRLYVDGKLEDTLAVTFNKLSTLGTPGPFWIGWENRLGFGCGDCDTRGWIGELDRVALWARSLSASEVEAAARRDLNVAPPKDKLIAYWTFNEGGGTTASDYSAQGFTGTLNGATWGGPADCQ